VEPRVYQRDGLAITFWTHYEQAARDELPPAEYARALHRLHAGLRQIDLAAPHFTDRVADAQRDVASRDVTPDLAHADREFLAGTLQRLRRSAVARGAAEQLLHGEPHPWNIHHTSGGPLFIDFESAVRGPVEFDLAWVPEDVCAHYPGINQELLDECRGLQLAIVAACRWRHDDEHPSGRLGGIAYLGALRAGPPWPSIVEWDE
jgi:aminoglycoside phosphotransferase (APT) family kinase protein